MDSKRSLNTGLLTLYIYVQFIFVTGTTYDFSNRGHTTIPTGIGTEAVTIDLSGNSLTTIAASEFSSFTNLVTIDLSDNDITSISDDAFSGLSNVQHIDLRDNLLTTYPDFSADVINSLLRLDLSRNNIAHIPNNVFYNIIQEIYLARNPIDWVAGDLDGLFAYTGSLVTLDVTRTGCTSSSLASGNFTHYLEVIETLTIDHCSPEPMIAVPELSPWLFTLLQISLRNNRLTAHDIEVSTLAAYTAIERMYLQNNIMTRIPNMPTAFRSSVLELDFSDNLISSIDWTTLEDYTALERLILDGNVLTSISGSAVLPGLLELNLQHNSINEITSEIFGNCSSLTTVDLSFNELTTFPNISTVVSSAVTVNLESNLFHCNCSFSFILEASDAYSLYSDVQVTLNVTPCASPDVFASSEYSSLTTEQICVECQPFASWYDIELDDGEVIELGGEVRYVCRSGYEFENGDNRKSSTCSVDDGSWSPSLKPCSVDTEEASMYEDVKEAKNANIIGSLAWVLVVCEAAFMLLLDSQHIHEGYERFKRNFCKKDKKNEKHNKKHNGTVHPETDHLGVPGVEGPVKNDPRSPRLSGRSRVSISVHGANTSYAYV